MYSNLSKIWLAILGSFVLWGGKGKRTPLWCPGAWFSKYSEFGVSATSQWGCMGLTFQGNLDSIYSRLISAVVWAGFLSGVTAAALRGMVGTADGQSHTWGLEPCRLRGGVAVAGAGEQHMAISEQHVEMNVLATSRDWGRTPLLHRKGSPADRAWLHGLVCVKIQLPTLGLGWISPWGRNGWLTTWCNLHLQVAAVKCRLWRWRRPVELASQCRAILHSVFCCAFPGLITWSSSEGIWQEHSSVFTGVWSQVLLVSFFSVISIRANCHLEFLCVEACYGFCFQIQIWYFFLPEEHLAVPRHLVGHLHALLRARI